MGNSYLSLEYFRKSYIFFNKNLDSTMKKKTDIALNEMIK